VIEQKSKYINNILDTDCKGVNTPGKVKKVEMTSEQRQKSINQVKKFREYLKE
jgi:hypothetical protein